MLFPVSLSKTKPPEALGFREVDNALIIKIYRSAFRFRIAFQSVGSAWWLR